MWGRGQGEGAVAEENELSEISPVIEAPLTSPLPPLRGRRGKRKYGRALSEGGNP
jgi:hypothetical protein